MKNKPKNLNKIVEEIVQEGNFSIASLESQYKKIKKKLERNHVGSLSLKDLKTLLAYEYIKDGSEVDFAKEILEGSESKVDLLNQLDRFGY